MNWITITIFAAIFQGTASLIDKYVLENEIKSPHLCEILWGIMAFIFFGLFSLLYGNLNFSSTAIFGGVSIGILYMLAFSLYYQSVPRLEISRLVPTMSLIPVFTWIYASIFLAEIFNWPIYLGIVLIIFGVMITDWQKKSKKTHLRFGYFLAISSCLLFTVKNVLTKYLSFEINSTAEIMFWIGLGALIGSIFLSIKNRSEILPLLKKKKGIIHLSFSTFLSVMGAVTFTWAIIIGPVSLVGFLDKLQIPYLFLLTTLIDLKNPKVLHEDISQGIFFQKLGGIIFILAGCFLLIN